MTSPSNPRLATSLKRTIPKAARTKLTTHPVRTRPAARSRKPAGLLDLRFLELDVLARNRIVLLEAQLLGLGARILLRHIEETRVCAADELDLDGCWLGHGSIPIEKRKAAAAASSRCAQ